MSKGGTIEIHGHMVTLAAASRLGLVIRELGQDVAQIITLKAEELAADGTVDDDHVVQALVWFIARIEDKTQWKNS